MADPKSYSVEFAEEPPDMSVVAGRDGGRDGAGVAWMRNDPPAHKGSGIWYPAGPVYLNASDEPTLAPLSWPVLLAVHRHLTVLRWGAGAAAPPGEVPT